jgi:hypothetical protein
MKLHISRKTHVVLDTGIPSRHKAMKLQFWYKILKSTHIRYEANSNTKINALKYTLIIKPMRCTNFSNLFLA